MHNNLEETKILYDTYLKINPMFMYLKRGVIFKVILYNLQLTEILILKYKLVLLPVLSLLSSLHFVKCFTGDIREPRTVF
jgi:hypothetical protein